MRPWYFLLIGALLTTVALWTPQTAPGAAKNPDPNHTHADFAVWLDGKEMDFSGPEFMSGESTEIEHKEAHDPYYHLHDGNGHVIHRHKPGLPLKQFFDSIKISFSGKCYTSGVPMQDGEFCSEHPFRMFVNGKEIPFSLQYVFADDDRILLTTAVDQAEVDREIAQMTDDACLYSQTCPERGKPPAENCIADPAVPCVE